jgi:Mg-chelatase subunit ChlD
MLAVLVLVGCIGSSSSNVSAQASATTASGGPATSLLDAAQHRTASDASAATAAGLFIVQIVDTSGTMAPAINAVAASEAEQYRISIRPGDTFLRVEFKCGARVSDFVAIHTADDVGRLAQVLAQPRESRGDTCPADGLALARETYLKEGAGRKVVLALTTDGEIDAGAVRTLDEERRRVETEARWWREHAVARVLVAVDRGGASHRGLQFIASALDARVVPLDQFAAARLIERQVTSAREQTVAKTAAGTVLVSPATSGLRWPWPMAAFVTFLLLLLGVLRGRRERSKASSTPMTSSTPAKLYGTTADVEVTVTDRGRISRFKRTLQENGFDHALTFGEEGAVAVAGIREPGVELSRDAESGELLVSVPAGVHVVVDGRAAPASGGTVPVRRGFTIRSVAFATVVVTSKSAPISLVETTLTERGMR